MSHLSLLLLILVLSIACIVWLTAKARINAFFVLLITAIGVGLAAGLPASEVITALKSGFGHLLEAIGIIVISGTVLGIILEKTGATLRMADYMLNKVGERNAPLAISLTGFIVGLPIFCDSGFVVLSGLNRSLVRRTGVPMAVMAVSLATSLYSIHCLVPPHPGVSAAVGLIGANTGLVLLTGALIALPATIAGYVWAKWQGMKHSSSLLPSQAETLPIQDVPSAFRAFLPVVVPVCLIALKAGTGQFASQSVNKGVIPVINFLGEPVVALLLGIGLALTMVKSWDKTIVNQMLTEGVDRAGPVLAIVGAGGAFGAVLKATGIAQSVGEVLIPLHAGIFLPFFITAVLKTVQGSSTVAIITAASLVGPAFPELGLDTEWGKVLGTLAMGTGSMMISHANDAYFWVITQFSELEPRTTFQVYSTATILMGVLSQLLVFALSCFVQ